MAEPDRPLTDARAMPWSEARKRLEYLLETASDPDQHIYGDEIAAIELALALGDRCQEAEQQRDKIRDAFTVSSTEAELALTAERDDWRERYEMAEQRLEAMQLCVCGHVPHETSRCPWCECGVYAPATRGAYSCPMCGWNEPHDVHAGVWRERAERAEAECALLKEERDSARRFIEQWSDSGGITPEHRAVSKLLAEAEAALTKLRADLARREGQTCETCRHFGGNAISVFGHQEAQWSCKAMAFGFVPMTINGKPFSCAGWQPRDDPSSADAMLKAREAQGD